MVAKNAHVKVRNKSVSRLLIASLLLVIINSNTAVAEMIMTHLSRATEDDPRQDYHIELLVLALDKTVGKYGPYRLVAAPAMNAARSMASVKMNLYPNFMVNEAVTAQKLKEYGYVPFPILRGIVGYRVFFVSPKARIKLNKSTTLAQLKTLTIGQGIGWLDVDLLKHNGFNVVVANNYEGLFKMVASSRIDLFARGIGEVMGEYDIFKISGDLYLDDSLAIFYPMPRYFFTHKSNRKAIERVTEGLMMAYNDGSLIRLWEKHHSESIARVNLSKRTIFKLENPFLADVDKSYEKYMYNP
ncbi:hypothetical protein ACQZV8_10070 [Magnetococcales bacterium HHB-1]